MKYVHPSRTAIGLVRICWWHDVKMNLVVSIMQPWYLAGWNDARVKTGAKTWDVKLGVDVEGVGAGGTPKAYLPTAKSQQPIQIGRPSISCHH
uniref:Uncharacterized protein n=1 Tax=Cannabis sativa TaxID=3483 RepID=A0A803P4X4_CANSA